MHDGAQSPVPVRAEILTHEVTDSEEVVIYDSAHRQLLVLNDLAAGVWLLIDGERSVDDLRAAVTECVDADAETVAEDVSTFLQQLVERNIVRWRTP
ncbi:MAG: PqqD family protein [Polyangiales bacterium]